MTSVAKIRADIRLVDQGLAPSRTRAQALILAGKVLSGERRIDKAGEQVASDAELRLKQPDHPWVSRGGLKLAHGLAHFAIDPAGIVALDIGASTGGFTHVLLEGGATRVYSVDVGKGQLDWSLRQDTRVSVLEGVNARYLTSEQVPEPVDLIACDASFISLKTVLPAALGLAADGARLVALIKPQFEVGKGQVGKGGVVRDPAMHKAVVDEISSWLDGQDGWQVLGVEPSPITGPKGNVEFLIAGQFTNGS